MGGKSSIKCVQPRLYTHQMKMKAKKIIVWTVSVVVVVAAVVALSLSLNRWFPRSMRIQGAVIRKDDDARKELPIPDALVSVSDGKTTASTQSDGRGYFRLTFPRRVWKGQTLQLSFRHSDYKPRSEEHTSELQSLRHLVC